MNMRLPNASAPVLAFGAMTFVWVLATACQPAAPVVTAPTNKSSCEQHTDCGTGEVCVGGDCRPGDCVPALASQCGVNAPDDVAPYCCNPWEFCNPLNECVRDPDSPVGTQCLVSDDCEKVGEFCSGGTCYSPQGRDACTASHQCSAGERCDRTIFLCVPDNGGCTFANNFVELACESGQLCDTETGFCVTPGGPQCAVTSDCRPGQQCDDLGRCVQCVADVDCGPGTECNVGTGNCISTNRCESDADCEGSRRCVPATNQCEAPECEEDRDCDDSREACDVQTFKCYLPLASCNESDEPNDTLANATDIPLSGYTGTLCRGNTDVLAFPVQADKRYRVTVDFPDFDVYGITVALLNTDGAVLDQDTLSYFSLNTTLSGISGIDETGTFYVRLTGNGSESDQWSYTVMVEETVAPQQVNCADETSQGIEPNDDFTTAHAITPGAPLAFARCGVGDEDFYKIVVPPLHGLEVKVEHEPEDGDLDVTLYDDMSTSDVVDSASTFNAVERVAAPEGATEFWVKVGLWGLGAITNQTYTITATATPRPAACAGDAHEPDTTTALAALLEVDAQPAAAIRCNNGDVDFYRMTVPANRGGQARITFAQQEGDLRLDLLNSEGEILGGSNRSTSADGASTYEQLDLPFAAESRNYFLRVRLHAASGSIGQAYQISATTYDASVCTLSEPVPNETPVQGRCVGTFETDNATACAGSLLPHPLSSPELATCASAATETPGCATICGENDKDWYRVGKLNNGQVLQASLQHDPTQGVLQMSLVRLSNPPTGAPVYLRREFNTAGEAQLDLSITAPYLEAMYAKEYAVVVEATGAGAYQAQPYALSIFVGEPCNADEFEGDNGNESPADPTALDVGVPGSASDQTVNATLCGDDEDVFEFYGITGSKVRAVLEGKPGMTVDIGTRPGTPGSPADTVACGQGVLEGGTAAMGCETPAAPEGAAADGNVRVIAEHTPAASGNLYLTVRRAEATGLGAYSLRLEITPAP